MKNFISRISVTQAALISILLWLILAAFFRQWLIYRNDLAFLTHELEDRKQLLHDLKSLSAHLNRFNRQLADTERQLAEARLQVPTDPEPENFLTELAALAKPLGVKIASGKEQDSVLLDHPTIHARELTVSLTGRADRIQKFDQARTKLKRFSHWEPAGQDKTQVSYQITIYYAPERPPDWKRTECPSLEPHLWLWPYRTWIAWLNDRDLAVCRKLRTYDPLQSQLKLLQAEQADLETIRSLTASAEAPLP